jgi:hypothetical protein
MPATKLVRRTLPVAGLLCVALSGCGQSEHDVVQAKVKEFEQAIAHKDAKKLCDDVIGPSLIEQYVAHGITCRQYWQLGLRQVSNPTLLVGRISVKGTKASAVVLSGAKGQESSLNAIELVKTGSGWRVSSLGSPVQASLGKP